MTKPLVSICVPVYNGQNWLRQCLDSCISQTYGNFEVVICDDGSSDQSVTIIETYTDPRIRFFKNEKNLGLVGNWNRCIEKANGEWIKFVFQDDYLRPDCLQVFSSNIDAKTVMMVSQRNFILEGYADEDRKNYYTNVVRTLENTASPQKDNVFYPRHISKLAIKNLSMNFIGEPSLTFFKKEIVKKVGYFDPLLKQICDLEFLLRAGSVFGLKYVREKICFFRIHEQSTTNTNISSNYFQLRYMEPLLLSWLLLYAPHYKLLRGNLSVFERFKLKLWFRLKCYQAGKAAEKYSRSHPVFDEQNAQFSEIRKHRNGNFLIRIIALLRK